jgi:hypothetical protein
MNPFYISMAFIRFFSRSTHGLIYKNTFAIKRNLWLRT